MNEPMRDPMRQQLMRKRRLLAGGVLSWEQQLRDTPPIPGHLCEVCLDAPATRLQPAPDGGEIGICEACAASRAKPKNP